MSTNNEIRIKSGTITKAVIGVLVLAILASLYLLTTSYNTITTERATLSSANQTIVSQNSRINTLQASISSLSGELNATKYDSCVPSVTSATTPVLLKGLTTVPLVVLDSQANSASNLILVGPGTRSEGSINVSDNELSQQLENEYGISMYPSTQIMQAYGNNRILIAGYYASQTVQAGDEFISALYSNAQNASQNGGISFQGIPIINRAGEPLIQVVIGSGALSSEGMVAANIAAAIGNLAYTSIPVTCSINNTAGVR